MDGFHRETGKRGFFIYFLPPRKGQTQVCGTQVKEGTKNRYSRGRRELRPDHLQRDEKGREGKEGEKKRSD